MQTQATLSWRFEPGSSRPVDDNVSPVSQELEQYSESEVEVARPTTVCGKWANALKSR